MVASPSDVDARSDVTVAIDQGSHATRAVAFDERGRRIASALSTLETRRDPRGWIEHDGEDLVGGVQAVLVDLATRVPARRWQALGLAVQRSTLACWERGSGALLSPVISWQDRRNAAWLARLSGAADRIHDLTGLPLSPHYGASKLRWCLDHLPPVSAAAAAGRLCAGPLAGLLLSRLLPGHPCLVDEANAARTQLWSPQSRDWSPELLQAFDLPRAVLPQLSPTCATFGACPVDGRQVPLRACTGDQAAVPFAAGPLDPGTAYVNLGTGAFVLRPTAGPLRARPLLTSVLASDDAGLSCALEGTVNGAGSALAWFEARSGLPADRLLSSLDAEPDMPPSLPLFLNGVSGLGSPFWQADFVPRFVGDAEPLQCFRAVVESIAFLLWANLEEMARHLPAPTRIVASGGLARSRTLLAALAALSRVPVLRLEDPEATARGAAFLAAGRPAAWDAPTLTRIEPAAGPVLAARYARWLEAMRGVVRT